MDFWFLHHSGVYLETENYILIFDYDKNSPAGHVQQGVVDPSQLPKNKEIFVFASHAHHDHFYSGITQWAVEYDYINVVLAYDIGEYPKCHSVQPNQRYRFGGVEVVCLASTDQGVGFLVKADGKSIYHAGDLNWWHWDGESLEFNQNMERDYKEYLQYIKGEKIDVAFLPVDPRQESYGFLGGEYFMEVFDVGTVVPIHLWGKYSFGEQFKNAFPQQNIVTYKKRGEYIKLEI